MSALEIVLESTGDLQALGRVVQHVVTICPGDDSAYVLIAQSRDVAGPMIPLPHGVNAHDAARMLRAALPSALVTELPCVPLAQ